MTKDIKLLYIAQGGIFLSVFDSQVMSLLKHIRPYLKQINLLVLEPYKHRNKNISDYNYKLSQLLTYFDRVEILDMPPLMGALSFRWAKSRAIKALFNLEADIIHCRGLLGSYIGLALRKNFQRKAFVVADLRGLMRQEIILNARSTASRFVAILRTLGLDYIERKICQESEHILCISTPFTRYLSTTMNINQDKMSIVPCLTDMNLFRFDICLRDQMRKKLNIEERVVLIYSGNLSRWQMVDETINLFKKIKSKISNAFLLFLTTMPEKAKGLFKEISPQDYQMHSVSYDKLPAFLNAADIGVLLREKNIVNEVASPVKLGEYLCCGLPVLISPGIGDSEAQIKTYELGGIVENLDKAIEIVPNLLKLDRFSISQWGNRLYGLEVHSKKILGIYSKLCGIG